MRGSSKAIRTLKATAALWTTTLLCRRHGILGLSTSSDLDIVTRQLGYPPSNFVRVSATSRDGRPIAIQTYPIDGGAKRRQSKARQSVENHLDWVPFPTLFWQTCPDVSQAIADLERRGYVRKMEEELRKDEIMMQQFLLAHKDYARLRWASLEEDDRLRLETLSLESKTVERMRHMLEFSGIAGGNVTLFARAIKCLHSHYAHFRSVDTTCNQVNPIGSRVHDILAREYPSLIL